jgi:hypothetical protein
MRSSRTITLFSERPEESQRPISFVASILVHGAVAGLVSLGILFTPKLDLRVSSERYVVRRLDLNGLEREMRASAGSGIPYPGPHSGARARRRGGRPAAQPAPLRQIAQVEPGPQTLVQPDIHSQPALNRKIPVPNVVIWSPAKAAPKTIVPPLPEEPAAAEVQPMLDPPNEEMNLADREISATNLPSPTQAIPASTTSPVVVHGPEPVKPVPVTTSESSAPPTPTAVVSLSDLHLAKGTVTLPPENTTAPKASQGELAPGQAKAPSEAASVNPGSAGAVGNGNGAEAGPDKGTDAGSGSGSQQSAGHPAGKGGGAGAGQGAAKSELAGNGSGATTGPAQGAEAGLGTGAPPSAYHISLPRDGQFSAVVVGSSLEQKYPETAGLLSGRLAYTVYLHVGLAKSWIMQYSLPRSGDAATAGTATRLEAPWPYNIVRPNIAPGTIDADALMIHGFVNQAGRFENLAIVFPPEFGQAEFVLKSLAEWQFRPAMRDGQIARVEVLLIIPEELE